MLNTALQTMLRPLRRHLTPAHCRRLPMRRDQSLKQLKQQVLLRHQLLLSQPQVRTPLVKLQLLLRS